MNEEMFRSLLARIIHDGSWRSRATAWQDGHVEP